MAIMSFRSRSRVKTFVVLTRADHLFIHNYIGSLINNILRPIIMFRMRIELVTYCLQAHTCVFDALAN